MSPNDPRSLRAWHEPWGSGTIMYRKKIRFPPPLPPHAAATQTDATLKTFAF